MIYLIVLYHHVQIPLENFPITGENMLSRIPWKKKTLFFHIISSNHPNLQFFVAAVSNFHITQFKLHNFIIDTTVIRYAE